MGVAAIGIGLLVDELAVDGYSAGAVITAVDIEGDGFADVSASTYSEYSAENGRIAAHPDSTDSLASPAAAPFLFVLPEATADGGDPIAPLAISATGPGDAGGAEATSAPSGEAASGAKAPAPSGPAAAGANAPAGLLIDDEFGWKPIADDGGVIPADDVGGDGFEGGDGDASGDYSGSDDGGTYGSYDYDYAGYGTYSAGDINGDGVDDSIVTTYSYVDGVYTSATFVVFGSTDGSPVITDAAAIDGSNGFIIDGASANGYGPSLAAAGDINGDGFADLIVNTYGWEGSGSAYVIFGNDDGAPSVDVAALDGGDGFRIDGLDVGEYGSWWLSAAGDVNGDGFDDLIINTYDWSSDGSYSQASYVLLGSGDGFAAVIDAATLPSAGDYLPAPEPEPEPEPGDDGGVIIGIGVIPDPDPGSDDDIVRIEPVICDIMPILVAWGEPDSLL